MDEYIAKYLNESEKIIKLLNISQVEKVIEVLIEIRKNSGRIFFLGVGGGAANASHAANDFRKIAGFEAYAPTDNVSELTARVNDEGWDTVFVRWLEVSKLNAKDGVFVFSVGGGSEEEGISVNIVEALKHAKNVGARILGVVGRNGGYTVKVADACVVIPAVTVEAITAQTEAFQALIWHAIVSHPKLKVNEFKWEERSK